MDPSTGTYSSTVRSPTGIPADPALASYGVRQAEQLGDHLIALDPPADLIFSSPYYRCLQTLAPYTRKLAERDGAEKVKITLEPGLGEFYGTAEFEHPSPAGIEELNRHFDHLHAETDAIVVPSTRGESITGLHDRVAYCLQELIRRTDADPSGPKALLVCSHAAAIICAGRVLTGRMPDEVGEEDFQCFTCGVSKFVRRSSSSKSDSKASTGGEAKKWEPQRPSDVPDVGWRDGVGVAGGWDCELNSDCSFLENGEERGW